MRRDDELHLPREGREIQIGHEEHIHAADKPIESRTLQIPEAQIEELIRNPKTLDRDMRETLRPGEVRFIPPHALKKST